MISEWTHPMRFAEVPAAGATVPLVADEAARKAIARTLDLLALDALEASVSVNPWFDGVEITGRWSARIAQACGISLDRLDSQLSGVFTVRAVTPDSIHAPTDDSLAELDVEADDPPDIVEGGSIDLAAYVVEHLALDIDPFPRKPGVEFNPPDTSADLSPFAALRKLRQDD